MNMRLRQQGISSLQVIVIIAVACVLFGWTVTFKHFTDRMNTAKTNAHFLSAVTMVKNTVNESEHSLSASQWVGRLNSRALTATNGGPAFIVNDAGNKVTGAIGVAVDNYGADVHVVRPAYLGLRSIRAVVRDREVTFIRVRRHRS